VSPDKKVVWEFTQADLPPDIKFRNVQTCERLDNGNTVIFSSTGGAKKKRNPDSSSVSRSRPTRKSSGAAGLEKPRAGHHRAVPRSAGHSGEPGDVQR